jgi:6,7-dimethyl-8-ribityllumazine synthase
MEGNVANTIEGRLVAPEGRFAIVASRFNDFIVKRLVEGCEDALRRHGVNTGSDLDVIWVPGAFEIPLACAVAAKSGKYTSVIALGAVIKGATAHFDYVCSAVTSGVMSANLESGVPVVFGVITTDTIEQAIERAGTKAGNKGFDAGMAALEMSSVIGTLEG